MYGIVSKLIWHIPTLILSKLFDDKKHNSHFLSDEIIFFFQLGTLATLVDNSYIWTIIEPLFVCKWIGSIT